MNYNNRLKDYIILALIGCLLVSCASQESRSGAAQGAESASKVAGSSNTETSGGQVEKSSADQQQTKASAGSKSSKSEQLAQAAEKKSDHGSQNTEQAGSVVQECAQQPYVRYQNQADKYIKQGWDATQAKRFGVGFRDEAEYKKWKDTKSEVFAKVSALCVALSDCNKRNKTDMEKKCGVEKQRFAQWQDLAKRFVNVVKTVVSTQPPMLCSLTPSVDDPSQCYQLLADRIENTCHTDQCKATSICFRGVYFLDEAINQAKLACSYVGQKLSDCRGYVEETGRRKGKFEQCLARYKQLPQEILPVISIQQ
jgi:hypothetical protein